MRENSRMFIAFLNKTNYSIFHNSHRVNREELQVFPRFKHKTLEYINNVMRFCSPSYRVQPTQELNFNRHKNNVKNHDELQYVNLKFTNL